ncbi:MAG TPA: beta-galactosidase, partial [Microbacteriaceae bacterium]|nr:beta-galactosidase [Microbacteriaceae bacterium]
SAGFTPSEGARATRWLDGVIVDGAEVLAGYLHPELGRFPAVTTRASGAGRITYVGTVPNPALAADLMRWVSPDTIASPWLATASANVTVASGTTPDGTRTSFISNWSSERGSIAAPHGVLDATGGERFAAGHEFSLEPWASLVLVDE